MTTSRQFYDGALDRISGPCREGYEDEPGWFSRVALHLGIFATLAWLCVFYVPVLLAIVVGGIAHHISDRT